MKITRVLLISIFLLTIFATPAQAAGKAVAFIPLLSDVDPNIPIPIQTQDALRPLMPQLLEAQQNGSILEFEASPSTGVLKIVYGGSGFNSAAFAGKQVFSDMEQAVASMKLPQLSSVTAGTGTTADGGLGIFQMTLYDNCFSAGKLFPGARITGSLREKVTNRVLASYDGVADGGGNINFGCFAWSGPYSNVTPGNKVTFQELNGTTLLKTYTVRTPNVTFVSIDKLNSIVRGTGPVGKSFEAYWYHPLWNRFEGSALNILRTGVVSTQGTWRVDFGTVKIRGNDKLNVIVQQTPNFRFTRWMDVPHIYCVLGGNYCEISGIAFKPAALKLVRGTTTYTSSGKFDAQGYYKTRWLNAAGNPFFLKGGDKLSGTGVAQYALPNPTASVNFDTNVVSGKMPKGKYFNTWIRTALGASYKVYSHSNFLGNYSSDFTSQVDLQSGDPMSVQIYYVTPLTGNAFDYFKAFGP